MKCWAEDSDFVIYVFCGSGSVFSEILMRWLWVFSTTGFWLSFLGIVLLLEEKCCSVLIVMKGLWWFNIIVNCSLVFGLNHLVLKFLVYPCTAAILSSHQGHSKPALNYHFSLSPSSSSYLSLCSYTRAIHMLRSLPSFFLQPVSPYQPSPYTTHFLKLVWNQPEMSACFSGS